MFGRCLLAATCILLHSLALAGGGAAAPGGEPSFEIHLQNRTILTDAGTEADLAEKLSVPGREILHGIVLLRRPPTIEDRKLLEDRGISLRQSLGGNAYIAWFREGATLSREDDLIRWAGRLRPMDRVQSALFRAGNVAESKPVQVLVLFFEHVPPERSQAVLQKHALSFSPRNSPASWEAWIASDKIKALSSEEEVRWIEEGPIPFLPLSPQ